MRGISQVVAAAILAWVGVAPERAQDYPTAPVHIVSGFPAGTTADISARVVGAKIGQILGQQFVVENRPGAASSLAAAAVARAAKDGYTLYIGSAANVINAAMNPNLTFDFVKAGSDAVQQTFAGLGDRDATRRAGEQPQPQTCFERADGVAER